MFVRIILENRKMDIILKNIIFYYKTMYCENTESGPIVKNLTFFLIIFKKFENVICYIFPNISNRNCKNVIRVNHSFQFTILNHIWNRIFSFHNDNNWNTNTLYFAFVQFCINYIIIVITTHFNLHMHINCEFINLNIGI